MRRSPTIARFAAEELCDRRKAAERMIATGQATRAHAHAELLPFMRLALDLDADLPWIDEAVAEVRQSLVVITGEWRDAGERLSRVWIADDLCGEGTTRAALIKARDRAISRAEAEPSRWPRASRLAALAWAYRCPPFTAASTQSGRKAA